MAKEIKTEIRINASAEKVWAILMDFENYPIWNPFITSIKGEVEKGNTITVRIAPPKGKAMTFEPKIIEKTKNKELRWIGRLLFKGLFDGEHKFELKDNNDGTTLFIQSERFSGILISMLNIENTKNGFVAMNQKLKELAEKRS